MKCGFCRTLKLDASMIKANASARSVYVKGGSNRTLCQGRKGALPTQGTVHHCPQARWCSARCRQLLIRFLLRLWRQ